MLANGLSIVRGFYIARFMIPAEYGVWSLIAVFLNYANYADVGINTGVLLEVPKLVGQGRQDEAQRMVRQGHTATLAVCGTGALLIMLTSFMPLQINSSHTASIRIVAIAILVLGLLNYYHVIARIQDRFGLIGLSTVVTGIVATAGVIAVVLIILELKVEIVVLTSLLGSGAAAFLLGLSVRPYLAWPPDWLGLWSLMKVGLPISIIPILFTFFLSADRWVAAILVSPEALGYYGLGTTIGILLYMLPATLAVVLFARQIERFGATSDPKASEPLVYLPLLLSAYSMAIVGGIIALSMPFIIHNFFPAYWPGRHAAIFQVVGNCLLFAVPVASNFLISTDRKQQVFSALTVGMLIKIGLVGVLVQTAWGIDGAALAVLVSDAVYGGVVAFLALRLFGGTMLKQLGSLALCLVPFGICLPLAALIIDTGPLSGFLESDIASLVKRLGLFGLLSCPSCLIAIWASGIFKHHHFKTRLLGR
jgi:O-antigen/teichoic acid export membrane protein